MEKEEQHVTMVRYWWSKAEESVASAQREFDASSYTFAINRLYYAVFYMSNRNLHGVSSF
jgi:uncharacterized protein (UPF0332 family)